MRPAGVSPSHGNGRAALPSLAIDFDELPVGAEFETRGRTIGEADVMAFATLTGDFHPQHMDAEFARESIFGERIGHGMLAVSYAIGLLPMDPYRVVALRRIRDATFKAPVRFGDTIRVRCKITELKPLDDRFGIVVFLWRIVNQQGATLVRMRGEVLWRRSVRHGDSGNGSDRDGRP